MVTIKQVSGAEARIVVRYAAGVLTVNGKPVDGSLIEYGESCVTVSDDPAVRFNIEPLPSEPGPESEPVEYIAPPPDSCTALQGRLALGEERCEQIAAMLPGMPWAARQAWEYAQEWQRKSSLLQSLAFTFGMTDADVDNLFRLAVTLEV